MKICVIGLGYIGFPTACLMARAGHQVVGVDVRESVVERLRNGDIHIADENGLVEVAQIVLRSGALQVSTTPVEADAFIICVPTPVKETHGAGHTSEHVVLTEMTQGLLEVAAVGEVDGASPTENVGASGLPTVDLSYVQSAVESIAPFVRHGSIVIVESTVPPGTTEQVVLPILERYGWTRQDVMLAHAPERVVPGAIMRELVENDRVVGGLTPEATRAVKELYARVVKGQIHTTDATTAEFVKLIENTFRDVNIALANELARVAEYLGIDVQTSISMANRHPRVKILNPGPGVGGHCIPVDPYFLIERAPELTPLMQAARTVNNGMVDHVVQMVAKLSKDHDLHRWVVLGAAYKADVGDERNSPSLEIAHRLTRLGFSIVVHDPHVERFSRSLEDVVTGADGLLLATDHSCYLELDPQSIGRRMSKRFLVDTRLKLDAALWERHGFFVRRLGDGRSSRLAATT